MKITRESSNRKMVANGVSRTKAWADDLMKSASDATEPANSDMPFFNLKLHKTARMSSALVNQLLHKTDGLLLLSVQPQNAHSRIFFAAFNQTRFVFYSWLRGVFNYGLLIVFASIVMSICIFGLNESLARLIASAQETREIFTRDYFFAVFWALVSIALILKAPDFAAMFSGGQAGSTAGIAAGMGLVTSSIAKGVKMGMKPAGKIGGNLMDRGLSNMPGGAGRAYSRLKGLYKGD